jgi:putative transcriptional regulator
MLVASPQMRDASFQRAVVLVWHHDVEGAVGVVVNRPLERTVPTVLDLPDDVDTTPYEHTTVAWGGPVEGGTGTVVTLGDVGDDEGWSFSGLGVSRSMDALLALLREGRPVLLCLGYAGWGPGQLDQEIVDGSWVVVDVDADLVFSVAADERYERALASLGLTPTTVWMTPIDE